MSIVDLIGKRLSPKEISGEIDDAVFTLVSEAGVDESAVALIQLLTVIMSADLNTRALLVEKAVFSAYQQTEDYYKAMAAFLEKKAGITYEAFMDSLKPKKR